MVGMDAGSANLEKASVLAQDVADLRIAAEIEKLDRDWAQQKERLLTQKKDGRAYVPTTTGANVGTAVGVGIGLVVATFGLTAGDVCVPMFGLMIGLFAVGNGIAMKQKAEKYQRARRRYQRRRREIAGRSSSDGPPFDFLPDHREPPMF